MPKQSEEHIDVMAVEQDEIHFMIVGTSPLILNRMSEKARRIILLPEKKTAVERQSTLKHNPMEEFQASPYTMRDPEAPTFLALLATAFKGAIGTAALDIPGAKKAQIGRLVYVNGDYISIYGEPQLLMSVVRSADINRTPDIRTRVIVPRWACEVHVTYVKPILREQPIINLLAGAGLSVGVGDWRPEKGKGSYGQFKLVSADDPDFLEISQTWGRAAQIAAMEHPVCYDQETEELLSWWGTEVERRGFKVKVTSNGSLAPASA